MHVHVRLTEVVEKFTIFVGCFCTLRTAKIPLLSGGSGNGYEPTASLTLLL